MLMMIHNEVVYFYSSFSLSNRIHTNSSRIHTNSSSTPSHKTLGVGSTPSQLRHTSQLQVTKEFTSSEQCSHTPLDSTLLRNALSLAVIWVPNKKHRKKTWSPPHLSRKTGSMKGPQSSLSNKQPIMHLTCFPNVYNLTKISNQEIQP